MNEHAEVGGYNRFGLIFRFLSEVRPGPVNSGTFSKAWGFSICFGFFMGFDVNGLMKFLFGSVITGFSLEHRPRKYQWQHTSSSVVIETIRE